jgi:outer membrane beta-barrel protein
MDPLIKETKNQMNISNNPLKQAGKSPMKNLFSKISLALLLTLPLSSSFAQDGKAPPAPPAAEKKAEAKDDIGNLRRSGIDVVQNRVFIKGRRHEVTIGVGTIFDNPLLRYEMAELRYTYHLREAIGLELGYSRAFNQNKAIINDLANIPCDNPPTLFDEDGFPITDCGVQLNPPPDAYKNIYLANVVWSPIYGKFSIFSKKILHFDIFLTAGAGMYDAARDNRFGFNIGVGTKIFLNEWAAVRVDFRNFTIKEGAPFNHIVNNRTLSLGMSFFLPTRIQREQ